MAAKRLEDHREEDAIAEIIRSLSDHRYSDASDLLKAELDKLADDLATVESEMAEATHLITVQL